MTGGIIGSVIGFSYGVYRGAREAGTILSWKALEYGIIGGIVSGVIGAAAGEIVYGLGSALTTVATRAGSAWLSDLVIAAHGSRVPSFGLGLMTGLALGVFDAPAAEVILTASGEAALSAVLFAYNSGAIRQWRLYPLAEDYFKKVIYYNLRNRPVTGYGLVRGASFRATWFFAGFAAGYATSKAIRWTTDKAINWLERAEQTYASDIRKDMLVADVETA